MSILQELAERALEAGYPKAALYEEAAAEITRLRGVIVGCEIALNRDEAPDDARRLILEERAIHGW